MTAASLYNTWRTRWGWSAPLLSGCVVRKGLEQEPLLWGLHCDQGVWTVQQTSQTALHLQDFCGVPFTFIYRSNETSKRENDILQVETFPLAAEKITSFSSWSQDLVLGLFPVLFCILHLCKVQKYKTNKSHTVTILAYQSPTHFERNALKREWRPLNLEWRKLPAQSINHFIKLWNHKKWKAWI